MFIARLGTAYLDMDKNGKTTFNNAPRQVVKFMNSTSFQSFMRDNHPDVKGKFELISLDSGSVSERITL